MVIATSQQKEEESMVLKELLEVLSSSVPYTIGAINGQGWIVHYDGSHKVEIPEKFMDRSVTNILQREYRKGLAGWWRELKAGLAIIVEGTEDGDI